MSVSFATVVSLTVGPLYWAAWFCQKIYKETEWLHVPINTTGSSRSDLSSEYRVEVK